LPQINIIVNDLMKNPTAQNIFETIQNYDSEGNILSCPVYADFDGARSVKDARKFVTKFEKLTGIYPNIFFSGNKGIHLVTPFIIKHPKCHLVVQHIVRSLFDAESLDHQVYTRRRLWRVPSTYHTKSGCYKTYISPEELFTYDLSDMLEIYKSKPAFPCIIKNDSTIHIKNDVVKNMVDEAKRAINKQIKSNTVKEFTTNESWSVNIFPCIRHILENCPEDGAMNTSICILAKFFKQHSIDCEKACNIIMEQPHYTIRQREQGDVIKVIYSIYKSNVNGKVGCKFNHEGELLRKFCDVLCYINPERPWFADE
jgi:hypothetical protein